MPSHIRRKSCSEIWTRIKIKKRKEKKALLLIEERYSFLINELTKEEKNRNESLENLQKY